MSAYDDYDEPRRYRSTRTRQRDRDEPDLVREETYIERGKGPGPRDLVFRGREDSIEDIPREFPPPAARDYRRSRNYDDDYYSSAPRRARSTASRRTRDYDDYSDRYTDYAAPAAGGAAAGYAAGRSRKGRDHRRDDRDYDSEYSRSPPRRKSPERRKSGFEDAIKALGLGGVAAAVTGKGGDKDDRSVRSKSRRRRGSSSSSRSRSRDRGPKKNQTERQWAQAAQAAVIAGAVEAFRSRKEPGPWTGDRGKRIATAAIGAGGIDKFLDRNPDEKSKRHLAEAVVGGLAANRLANGPRSKSRGRNADSRPGSPDSFRSGRSRSRVGGGGAGGIRARSRSIIDRFRGRSQSRGRPGSADDKEGGGNGGLKGLVAGGALAAAGKAVYDRVRSKSRRRRSPSSSSADSYVPSRTRRRDRRRSPRSDTGSTRQSLATERRREIRDTRDTNNDYNASGALTRGAAGGAGLGTAGVGGKSETGKEASLSDSSSTTDMENKRKRMRGKEFLTAGLASIATIHAAHGIYSSMEAHEKRHRLVAEGEMTPEEARKKQTKAWVQDAAAVGIAALGIKGAFSEWKGMNEQRREIRQIEQRKRERRKRVEARERKKESDREERMMQLMAQNPQMAMMQQGGGMPMMSGGMGGMPMYAPQQPPQPPPPDNSGNPYASQPYRNDLRY
ncbi:hypothetical protein Q7P37_001461 [Cladosporium fusiforme]